MRLEIRHFAEQDIDDILATSLSDFGYAAQQRYGNLLEHGFEALLSDPRRPGTRAIIGRSLYLFHLKWVRGPSGRGVGRPPHLIVYRVEGEVLFVERVLHEKMELLDHLDLIDR